MAAYSHQTTTLGQFNFRGGTWGVQLDFRGRERHPLAPPLETSHWIRPVVELRSHVEKLQDAAEVARGALVVQAMRDSWWRRAWGKKTLRVSFSTAEVHHVISWKFHGISVKSFQDNCQAFDAQCPPVMANKRVVLLISCVSFSPQSSKGKYFIGMQGTLHYIVSLKSLKWRECVDETHRFCKVWKILWHLDLLPWLPFGFFSAAALTSSSRPRFLELLILLPLNFHFTYYYYCLVLFMATKKTKLASCHSLITVSDNNSSCSSNSRTVGRSLYLSSTQKVDTQAGPEGVAVPQRNPQSLGTVALPKPIIFRRQAFSRCNVSCVSLKSFTNQI